MRWSLLKDRSNLKPEAAADLDTLIAKMTTVRTARAWLYKEQLREILERKQINVVRARMNEGERAREVISKLEGMLAFSFGLGVKHPVLPGQKFGARR